MICHGCGKPIISNSVRFRNSCSVECRKKVDAERAANWRHDNRERDRLNRLNWRARNRDRVAVYNKRDKEKRETVNERR